MAFILTPWLRGCDWPKSKRSCKVRRDGKKINLNMSYQCDTDHNNQIDCKSYLYFTFGILETRMFAKLTRCLCLTQCIGLHFDGLMGRDYQPAEETGLGSSHSNSVSRSQ